MKISAKEQLLSQLIAVPNYKYVIKAYQRPYSWEKEQREDYWNDLEDLFSGETDQHFFGSILVINKQTGSVIDRELVDGQQRVTTTMILFCAIRDLLQSKQIALETAIYIDQNILNVGIPPKQVSRLVLQGNDNGFFVNHILPVKKELDLEKIKRNFPKGIATTKSEKKLRDCYLFFIEQIWAYCKGKPEALGFFAENVDKMLSNVWFIDVVAENLESAYSIFGAMNNRGLPLSAADLIKNALLEKIAGNNQDKQETFNQQWVDLNDTLGESSDLTTFIRHWWITRTKEKVTKDKLFRLLEASINESPSAPQEMLKSILDSSVHYNQLLEPERDHVKSYEAFVALKTIADLRASLSYPLLLQAKIHLPDHLFEDICIKIESLTVRYSTICKKASKNLDNMFQKTANLIGAKKEAAYDEILAELRAVMPDDETVTKEFSDDTPTKNIDVILRRLALTSSDSEIQIGKGKDVHIEHILPQTLKKEWKEILDDNGKDAEIYTYKWGNLTLLSGKKNTTIQNSIFEKKCEFYLKSDIPMTKALPSRYKVWNYDAVNRRTEELAKRAVEVWKSF